jgi:peptidoglycan pentaglycine glycine transferase (the first glycine)
MTPSDSPLQIQVEHDVTRWNATILQLPYHHVLQSFQWGQFKSRHGWSASPLLFRAGGEVRAAALVLRRALPRLPWGVMYVPKGPLLDYSNLQLADQVLAALEAFARSQKALVIKIDPDVSLDDENPELDTLQVRVTAPTPARPASAQVVRLLGERGWVFSREQIQFRNTALLDLKQNEASLLESMKPKTRYNVRLAARKGVRIRTGGLGDLVVFYRLYAETSARDGFLIRPFEYYRDVWQTFLRDDLAVLLLAELDGLPLAGLILFRLGRKVWYMYGASSAEGRNAMPNYLLQWEAICLCRERGDALYDLWGAPDELVETDPMWGVYRFKEGLGAHLVRHIGAYDFPASRPLFFLFQTVLPRYLALLRRFRQQPPLTTADLPG